MKRALLLLLLILPFAYAQEACTPSECIEEYRIDGYDITFHAPEHANVGDKLTFSIDVMQNGTRQEGLEVQGRIVDPENDNEIFFAQVQENAGTYSFTWTPNFAGTYHAQFQIRTEDKAPKITYPLTVADPRATYALWGLVAAGIISIAIGLYLGFRKKFNWKSLATGAGFGLLLILLGYSVSTFYESGGERGFVICGEDGCDLAIHWHTQLTMTVCGEPYHLPLEVGDLDRVHTHKERDYLHFHSLVKTDPTGSKVLEPEKLAVGDIFEQLGIPFNSTCFNGKCNGETCNGEPGELRMTVNGIPNEQYDEYSYNDGDEIRITFGPQRS